MERVRSNPPMHMHQHVRNAGIAVAAIAASLLAVLAASAACWSPTESEEFSIRVDSVTGPAVVSGGAAFEQRLWGTVGPNTCHRFVRLRTERTAARLDVTAIGHRSTGNVVCGQAETMLDGVVLRVEPVVPDPFTIVVHQPDGSTLTRTIRAE